MKRYTTKQESQRLNEIDTNFQSNQLDSCPEWVTVEEMRAILKKENDDFYSKL